MKQFIFIFFIAYTFNANAQTDEFCKQYDDFKSKAQKEYCDFRNEANRQYAEFMRQAWQQYKALPAIPKPKDETVPPVVMPEGDRDKLIDDKPVVIEEIIMPPAPEPQPVPIVPIREKPQPEEKYVGFAFYGTDCKVRFNGDERFTLADCGNQSIANAWEQMSGDAYNNTVRDCLELRISMQLCDWAYLNMLDAMAEACLGKTNEATMFAAFVYCQSGYKVRIGRLGARLCLLYASEHVIYDQPYFNIGGDNYYVFKSKDTNMEICEATMPKEKSMSLYIPDIQKLSLDKSQSRILQSERYPEIKVQVVVNKNLIKFYDDYPTSEIDNNFMTRWAMYAKTPMDSNTSKEFYVSLKENIKEMGEKAMVERLLNFVQTAFVYEYDDKVWGYDRAFFTEETLYYPYCDCEDRSILFSRLVRDLVGLDVILVFYPGHLATAVCFDDEVNGDYIMVGNRKYVVCDPTYIGAPVGATMPGMDNKAAHAIVLN